MWSKLYSIYSSLIKFISSVLLVVLSVVVFISVIFRFIIKSPLVWPDELSRYLFVWIVFLGSALGFQSNSHLGIDVIVKALPRSIQRLVLLFGSFVVLFFLSIVIYHGYKLTVINMGQPSPGMRIPIGYAYMAVPVGGVLMFLEMLIVIKNIIKNNYKLHSDELDEYLES